MSNFLWVDNALCIKNQMLMFLIVTLAIFCIQKELLGCQSNPVAFKR